MNGKKIFIADDDQDIVENLSIRCRSLGLEVEHGGNAMSALARIEYLQPDVVCLDIQMPPGNGLAVAEMMAHADGLSNIPVIVMTGLQNKETLARARTIGARVVCKGTGFWDRMEPAIRETLAERKNDPQATPPRPWTDASRRTHPGPRRAVGDSEGLLGTVFNLLCEEMDFHNDSPVEIEPPHETPDPWVLTIDDDPDFSLGLQKRLEEHGITVLRAFEGMQGYRTAFSRPVDAVICDYSMPNGTGDYILRRLKENPVTRDIPVIVLTGRKDRALERKLMNLGAARYFTKPYNIADLVAELKKHIRLPAGAKQGPACHAAGT
jgi:DNA-binding response OmpR family regulator